MFRLLLFSLFSLQNVNSLTTWGEIITDKPWTFLSKFCFNPASSEAPGVFTFDFVYPKNSTFTLLVYWYADNQWKEVYQRRDSLTCQDKIATAQKAGNRFDIHSSHWRIEETDQPRNMVSPHLDKLAKDGETFAHSRGQLTFSSGRERWYYFAIANCDPICEKKKPNHCNGEIVTTYALTFTNGAGWDKGVTADVQGLAESSIALFIFWLCVSCCVLTFQLASMSRRRMLHTTVKILVQALVWHILELFFATIYFTNNIDAGYPSKGLRVVYRICAAISETEIVLLLILIGKGWTVVRRKISPQGRVRITAFITVYACVQFAVVTWEATVGSDPADIIYLYESPPGFVLLCLRAYGLIWFLRAIVITRIKYTRKRGFYWKFALLGTLWMIALPLQVGIASQAIAVHQRPRFVFAFNIVVNMLFFTMMFALFSPSKFNRAFPFHAKTSDMEARAPASTSWTARSQAGGRRGARNGGNNGNNNGSVEMTANGPIFRKNANGGGGRGMTGSARSGARALSGGLAMGTPEERVRFSIEKIRSKITQLNDHSDDLEYALDELDLHDWDSPGVKDEDYDLPDSRNNAEGARAPGNAGGNNTFLSGGGNGGSNGGSNGGNGGNTNSSKKKKKSGPRPPPEE